MKSDEDAFEITACKHYLKWNSYLVLITAITCMEVCVILGLKLLIAPNFSQLTLFSTMFYLDTRKTLVCTIANLYKSDFLPENVRDEEEKKTCETRTLKEKNTRERHFKINKHIKINKHKNKESALRILPTQPRP